MNRPIDLALLWRLLCLARSSRADDARSARDYRGLLRSHAHRYVVRGGIETRAWIARVSS
ncbi:hypothetical protein BH09MYX1_BH09MYX1_67690 [soil metagenome]